MIKGYTSKQNAAKARAKAAASRTTTAPGKRGRPKKMPEPPPAPIPLPQKPPAQMGIPLLFPEQLRTCLMAKEDVEAAVKKAFQEIMEKWEEKNNQRRVPLGEAMERLHVKSRSTMWHWHDKGYLIQLKDKNKHVYYPEYKIRRAERGEHPEGKDLVEEQPAKKGGQQNGRR